MNYENKNFFKDNFYSIKRIENNDSGFVAHIQLNEKHWIYSSHFPENPITPGVCLVQIARELIVINLKQNLNITTVKNIKFLNIIVPGKSDFITFKIAIKKDEDDAKIKANIVIEDSKIAYTKISMVLGPKL